MNPRIPKRMRDLGSWTGARRIGDESLRTLRPAHGPALEATLAHTPVVLVVGPRQAGKTTLCRLVADRRSARVLSFDDAATLAAATADPAGFIAALSGPVVLDEIQKAPALLPAIKLAVDRRREPERRSARDRVLDAAPTGVDARVSHRRGS